MKLLFLAHRLPFPPNKGDKIRSYNILRYLAERHEVHLGCLVDEEADLHRVAGLRSLVSSIVFDRIHPRFGRVKALPQMLRSRALSVSYFHSARLQRDVDATIASAGIEAIFCSSSPMAEYVFQSSRTAAVNDAVRIMDLIDVDSLKWQQYAASSPPWAAWIYRYEARSLAAYEARIVRNFHRVLVVSEAEKSHVPLVGTEAARIVAVPNGVDLDYFAPGRGVNRLMTSEPLIVFTGVMDYWPNVDGVVWFVERVLPQIRAAVPGARFLIVGNHPNAKVRRLGDVPGVTVTGFVEDVRDYVAPASLCVVPVRIARGTQNKLLEAMAMGKPVVSTSQAFEGLRAQAGRDLLVADDEASFARAAIGLLKDAARSAELGRNARECMEQGYRWVRNLSGLDDLLQTAPAQSAGSQFVA